MFTTSPVKFGEPRKFHFNTAISVIIQFFNIFSGMGPPILLKFGTVVELNK